MHKNAAASRPSFLKKVIKDRMLLLLLLPGTLYLLINNYLPMFGTIIAFKDFNYAKGIWGSDWSGFKNFEYLFNTPDAWVITRNTVGYNALFIIVNTIAAVVVAVALNELKNRIMAKFFQSVMLLPHFLSMVVISYLVYSLLSQQFGYINKAILEPLGLDAISWYTEPKFWPFILPLVNLWAHIGFVSVIYLAAIIGIDNEYYEAAIIDGANKWQQIRSITLPLIIPVITIMTLLAVGKVFNSDFGLFYQVPLDAGALYPVTQTIDTYVYNALLRLGDLGMSSASGVYQSVVGFVLVMATNWIVRKVNKDNALF